MIEEFFTYFMERWTGLFLTFFFSSPFVPEEKSIFSHFRTFFLSAFSPQSDPICQEVCSLPFFNVGLRFMLHENFWSKGTEGIKLHFPGWCQQSMQYSIYIHSWLLQWQPIRIHVKIQWNFHPEMLNFYWTITSFMQIPCRWHEWKRKRKKVFNFWWNASKREISNLTCDLMVKIHFHSTQI